MHEPPYIWPQYLPFTLPAATIILGNTGKPTAATTFAGTIAALWAALKARWRRCFIAYSRTESCTTPENTCRRCGETT